MPPSATRTSAVARAISSRLRNGRRRAQPLAGEPEAVAGDAVDQRVAAERVLGQHVEGEPGGEAGQAAQLGPSRKRQRADDDQDEVGCAGDEREVGGDGQLQQDRERQGQAEHDRCARDAPGAHGEAPARAVSTSTCENASRSTSGVTWITLTSASLGSLTCVATPIGSPGGQPRLDPERLVLPAARRDDVVDLHGIALLHVVQLQRARVAARPHDAVRLARRHGGSDGEVGAGEQRHDRSCAR